MTGELRALTSARGIAAWWIVLYHIRGSIAGLPAGAEAVLAKGYLAVDFFFLLSGFVIWLAWGERLRKSGPAGVPAFLKKRVARIWPLHLFTLAGAVALAALLQITRRADPVSFPWAQLPLHVLLVQNWGFTDRLAWNDPAWSISAELGAYLLFPLLVLAVDWRRLPAPAVLAAVAAAFVLLASAMAPALTLGTDIARFGLVRCLCEFAAGTAMCALWLRWRERPRVALGCAGVAGSCAIAWALGVPETLAVPPTFAALLLALALTSGRAGNPLEARWLHWLGEVSYATYLSHFLLWRGFKLVAVRDADAVPPGMIAAFLLLVLIASGLLYRWVERPGQRLVNGWRLFPAPLAATRHPGLVPGSTAPQGHRSEPKVVAQGRVDPGTRPG
ncbi:acyltransferase [Sphingomonas aracearum]|uniref:Acyltransferase n=1 Tax=Sphingomonas aracearum TaxID=2283317 RepID=A0A369W218_9SPHN|nr:acyltransferase [Sphingomonas aracearum]